MQLLNLLGLSRLSLTQHGLVFMSCLAATLLPEAFMLSGLADTPVWSIAFVWYPVVAPALLYLVTVWLCGRQNLWIGIAAGSWMLVIWALLSALAPAVGELWPLLFLLRAPGMFAGEAGDPALLIAAGMVMIGAWRLADLKPIKPGRYRLLAASSGGIAMLICAVLYSVHRVPEPVEQQLLPETQDIYADIVSMYDIGPRRPGTALHKQATNTIHKRFLDIAADAAVPGAFNVYRQRFEVDTWNAEQWLLTASSGGEHSITVESFYTPWSNPTEEDGVEGALVYVGAGAESDLADLDLAGKIVLVDYFSADIHEGALQALSYMSYGMGAPEDFVRHKLPTGWAYDGYLNFVERIKGTGAIGLVGILNGYPDFGEFTYYAPYNGKYAPVSSVYVPEDEGRRLKALLEAGPVTANLRLQARAEKDSVEAVYAVMRGKGSSSIAIHSHMDSPWASAVEDSSGVGMVLGLAQYYAQLPADRRPVNLVFLLTADHFAGGQSTERFIEEHQGGLFKDLLLDICVEHIALEYNPPTPLSDRVEPGFFFVSENPVIVSQLSQVIQRYGLSRNFLLPTATPIGMPNDGYAFWREGYNVVANISGPSWLFDKVDTLDKVAVDRLLPTTALYADLIEQLARYPEFVLSITANHILLFWFLLVANPALFVLSRTRSSS